MSTIEAENRSKSLFDRMNSLDAELRLRREEFDAGEIQRAAAVSERDRLADQQDLLKSSALVVEDLVRLVAEQDLGALKKLLSQALNLVFPDRGYGVDIVVDKTRGAQGIRFDLLKNIHGQPVTSDIRSDVGGGVKAVVGLIDQVFYIRQAGLPRFIAMDENLSQLSDDYVENLFNLLKVLHEKMGFDFLLVTHDVRFKELVGSCYTVRNGSYSWGG